MMERRRRALIAGGESVVIPSGYVKDGLVFFLDGKQLASATKWTDIVGGKVFLLTGCSIGSNGIYFDGNAYGETNGSVSDDYKTETIEVVLSGPHPNTSPSLKTMTILSQPYANGKTGIGLRFGDDGGFKVRCATGQTGIKESWYTPLFSASTITRLSVAANQTNSGACVYNGSQATSDSSSSYGANTTDKTVLGARRTTSDTTYNRFTGTIHGIRIYNRKLSVAEMQSNQSRDLTYYGLS